MNCISFLLSSWSLLAFPCIKVKSKLLSRVLRSDTSKGWGYPLMSLFIMFFLSTFQPSLASSQQLSKSKLPWFWTYALASIWNSVSEIFHSSSSFRPQSCYSLSRQSSCNHMHSTLSPTLLNWFLPITVVCSVVPEPTASATPGNLL